MCAVRRILRTRTSIVLMLPGWSAMVADCGVSSIQRETAMTQSDPDQDPGLEPDPLRRTTRRTRSVIIVAAAAAVTLLSALLSGLAVMFIGGQSNSSQPAVPLPLASTTSASTAPTRPPTTATPTPKPTTPEPTTPVGAASPTPSPSASPRPFAYQPLWPFVSTAEAAAWQRRYRAAWATAVASGRGTDRAVLHHRLPRLLRDQQSGVQLDPR